MMKRMLLHLSLALMTACCYADEVEDAINAALASYKAGKPTEAADHLRKASDLLNEKAGNTLGNALPKTIGPWTGGKVNTNKLDGLGGGQTAERNYRNGEKDAKSTITATISLVAGSPTLAQVSGFLSNPALGALIGARTKDVRGQSAMYIPKEGILQMVVEGKYLLVVRSKKCSEEQLADLAAGVDLNVLKAIK
jgi:hypothetical protein